MNTNGPGKEGLAAIKLVALVLVAGGIAAAAWGWRSRSAAPLAPAEQFQKAVAEGAALANEPQGNGASPAWPATPETLIRAFWDAVIAKDYAKVILFCPGSTEDVFKGHYDAFTPSPVRSIGAAEPSPKAPGKSLYPTVLDFPHFANKTVKMAVVKLPDGRWAIDGQNTVWW